MPRVIASVLLIVLLAYVGLAGMFYLNQTEHVFLPSRILTGTPRDVGLSYDEVRLQASDGVALSAWFVPARGASTTLLFLHGNAGNISNRLDSLRVFNRLGLSTLILDYRGFGASEGEPSEEGTYRDAEAAWRYLTETRGIPPERIVLLGRSLGGAVAAYLATRHRARALVLESTFTSLPDLGAELYPYLPVRMLARIHYDTLRRLAEIHLPLLVVHSPGDDVVPYHHGERIYAAAHEPKAFLRIRGHHHDGFLVSGQTYTRGLTGFLEVVALGDSERPEGGQAGEVEGGEN